MLRLALIIRENDLNFHCAETPGSPTGLTHHPSICALGTFWAPVNLWAGGGVSHCTSLTSELCWQHSLWGTSGASCMSAQAMTCEVTPLEYHCWLLLCLYRYGESHVTVPKYGSGPTCGYNVDGAHQLAVLILRVVDLLALPFALLLQWNKQLVTYVSSNAAYVTSLLP